MNILDLLFNAAGERRSVKRVASADVARKYGLENRAALLLGVDLTAQLCRSPDVDGRPGLLREVDDPVVEFVFPVEKRLVERVARKFADDLLRFADNCEAGVHVPINLETTFLADSVTALRSSLSFDELP
jgi:hypothetical protein